MNVNWKRSRLGKSSRYVPSPPRECYLTPSKKEARQREFERREEALELKQTFEVRHIPHLFRRKEAEVVAKKAEETAMGEATKLAKRPSRRDTIGADVGYATSRASRQ